MSADIDVCRHVCPVCGGCDICCLRPRHCQACHDAGDLDYHESQGLT